jgi:multiple sugar transport system substrate-binding protein
MRDQRESEESAMDENRPKGITRRDFIKTTGAGLLAAGLGGANLITPGRARAAGKSLKILQWAHFVPSYDTDFFDPFAKKWGEANGVEVTVDHIGLAELPARTAAEISAGEGHDLIEWVSPPSQLEPSVLDLTDLNLEAKKRFGKQLRVCTMSSFNPHTKKYYGFCPGWTIDPGDYRKSLWTKAGKPAGPDTWEDLITYGSKIKNELGVQLGIGMSQEIDSNMAARALIWSYGISVQDENENVVINNPRTVEAVEYMTRLYKTAMTPEIFSWSAVSNNQALIAGRASYILNSISAYRSAQQQVPEIAKDVFFVPALKGPTGTAWSSEHVIYIYVIPKYSKNADTAKEFILALLENYDKAMYFSKDYNSPAFFDTRIPAGSRGYPPVKGARTLVDLNNAWFDDDPFRLEGEAKGKLTVLKNAREWSTNVGHPGPANPAIGEVFSTFILPNMMASAARGMKASDAVAQAEHQIKTIFDGWRRRGLVGGTR